MDQRERTDSEKEEPVQRSRGTKQHAELGKRRIVWCCYSKGSGRRRDGQGPVPKGLGVMPDNGQDPLTAFGRE